ncbi:Sodium/hydrogen exchanger family-domain-containing protein [Xylaria sp. FL1777]|nr:Sodium/hydrogen exchanger family-domain-containing protein [Xylaria sp. FL1777]
MTTSLPYLPYHEPSLVQLLISSTFLLALNSINSVLDRTLACGLVGQVLIGTAWGQPGAQWLPIDSQRVVSSLGYLGLILVVYAGGVETNVVALRKNLVLSVAVAVTGVIVPIGLSFALLAPAGPFLGTDSSASLLPAFAAGAALCSTSLGTTFSVLQASGLSRTRLGAVLASAALIDDVVGLVMVRIIASLGQTGNKGIEPATILRPVLVSAAFAVAVPLVCRYVLKPAQGTLGRIIKGSDKKEKQNGERNASNKARVRAWVSSREAAFLIQTAFLILLIVAADYAGTSVLLAAYLAGVVVSWWHGEWNDSEESPQSPCVDTPPFMGQETQEVDGREPESTGGGSSSDKRDQETLTLQDSASGVFDTYFAQVVNRVLKPFFFASIGFSIPISQLFVGKIVWRGIIYSLLMIIGKLVCGLWLVRLPMLIPDALQSVVLFIALKYNQTLSKIRNLGFMPGTKSRVSHETQSNESSSTPRFFHNPRPANLASSSSPNSEMPTPPKPLSLYPSAVMGCAMVARGEIGFLISSMAESQGVFRHADEDASEASELFLIVTWAIFLCTILGPLCTGILVRRIRRLEKATESSRDGAHSVLGAWGFV